MKTIFDTTELKIEVDHDFHNPLIIINGIEFTFEFLNHLTKTFPLDQWFSLLQRKDGYITFHTHREEQEKFEEMKSRISELENQLKSTEEHLRNYSEQ